jgi:hypothetical protein
MDAICEWIPIICSSDPLVFLVSFSSPPPLSLLISLPVCVKLTIQLLALLAVAEMRKLKGGLQGGLQKKTIGVGHLMDHAKSFVARRFLYEDFWRFFGRAENQRKGGWDTGNNHGIWKMDRLDLRADRKDFYFAVKVGKIQRDTGKFRGYGWCRPLMIRTIPGCLEESSRWFDRQDLRDRRSSHQIARDHLPQRWCLRQGSSPCRWCSCPASPRLRRHCRPRSRRIRHRL